MPMATPSTGTPREDLLGAFSEIDPASQGFIARLILPPLLVSKRVGDYGKMPLKAWMQRRNTKRAPMTRTSRSTWTPEDGSFKLREYSHEQPVDKVNSDLYMDWFDAEDEAAKMVRHAIELDLEADVSSLVFNQTTFPADDVSGHDATNPWSSTSSGTPLDDIAKGKKALNDRGLVPDTLVVTRNIAIDLALNDQIIDRVKYVFGGVERPDFDEALLARLLGVPRVLIANGKYDSANAASAATLAGIWSDNFAMLCCTSNARNLNGRPHLGRIFEQSNSAGVAMYSYEESNIKSVIVGAEQHVDPELIYEDAGYLIGGVNT